MSEKSSEEDIIPKQESGIETNTETSVAFNSPEEAKTFYQK